MEINSKPKCFVFDLDGTITDRGYKKSYREVDFNDEYANEFVCKVFQGLMDDYTIFIITGREESYREDTLKWLKERRITPDELYMRQPEDDSNGLDFKLKELEEISKSYHVEAVFEDRRAVVKGLRKAKYKVFDVANHAF